jgi:hypothetical protein
MSHALRLKSLRGRHQHHHDWHSPLHQLVIDPNVQGERETVVVVLRQEDLLAAYRWALHITGQLESADIKYQAGRGLLMALPSEPSSTATANERYSFETIACVAENLSYHLKSKIAHHVAVNRVDDLEKLSARLDRLSTIIAAAVTPKFETSLWQRRQVPPGHLLADCPSYRADGGCHRCASPNHLARNCPL